jgi:hypothetical protein
MSAPTFPLQQGSTKALQIAAPIFANVVVQEDTWKEKDSTRDKDYRNGASLTYLTAFADPGVDAACEWVVNVGQALYVKGQSITPTTDTVASPRTFLIKDVDNSEYNGFVCKQAVKLQFKVAQTGLT